MNAKISPVALALAAALTLGTAHAASEATEAASATEAQSRIAVDWVDPAQLTEYRRAHDSAGRRDVADSLKTLSRHLRIRADKMLPEGQSLAVHITDLDLAGEYEPWHRVGYENVRIIRSTYPPEIKLTYALRDAQGQVLREGETTLRDPGFQLGASPVDQNALRYEKRMLDSWLRREFSEQATAQN